MDLTLQTLFWLAAASLAATFVIYPASMPLLARARRRHHATGEALPSVTLVISAFNEAAVIRRKVENALALDYPRDRLEILVISDGSDDGTDEIVAGYAARGVVLRRQEPRAGKTAGLTRFVPEARGEIVVFSDANSMYDRAAIRMLVRNFADPAVGYVVGHQRYYENAASDVAASEGAFWDHEVRLKRHESDVSSVVGGDGAIYAIRAEHFEPLDRDDINDFVNPLQIVAKGYRGVFEPEAFCYEHTPTSMHGEFRRKTRIVNRALRAVLKVPAALDPFRVGWFAYQLLLHKVTRWFTPWFLVVALVASVALAARGAHPIYELALLAQLAFYACAALRPLPGIGALKPVSFAYYFCLSSVAALIGTAGALGGRRVVTWTPERGAEAGGAEVEQ